MDNKENNVFLEFHPKNWLELKEIAIRFSGWVFRGQSDSRWKLETTLERTAKNSGCPSNLVQNREQWILKQFQRRAHHYINDPPEMEESLEWMSLIQHHGGPTRLLDFTHSIYVAAFFALERSQTDAAVWAINTRTIRECADSRVKEMYGNDTSNNFDKSKPYNLSLNGKFSTKLAVNIEPFRMNERLAIQQGLFLFPFDVSHCFEENLFGTFYSDSTQLDNPGTLKLSDVDLAEFYVLGRVLKIILPKQIHDDAKKDLKKMNINAASLFPGLDGFARSLHTEFDIFHDFKDKS